MQDRSKVLALVLLAGLAAAPAAAQAPEWVPAGTGAKAAPPGHWSGLPEGSVTPMAVAAGKAAGPWTLHLPDGSRHAVEGVSERRQPNGDRTYAGTVAGAGALYPVLLTVGREASFASFRTPGGRWQMEARGGRAWLLDLTHGQLAFEPADAGSARGPATLRTATASGAAHRPKAAAQASIDVLFLYDQAFAARYPGTVAETRINHFVAIANQAFADSGVSLALRLVAADATSYQEPGGDNGTALEQLALTLDGEMDAFAGLAARRAALGADLVTLVRPHDIELRGSCGIAYFPDANPALGVNVLSDSFDGWSLCSDDVYAHEVGHNLGAQHQDGANAPGAGYATPWIVPGRLHTVMGSFGTGHPDRYLGLSRFSNPALRCGGGPCGLAGVHDNARKLRETMATVAAYQPSRSSTPVQAPPPLDPDVDGDGVGESEDAFPHDPAFHADADNDGVADAVDAFPSNPAESQDTDGDGNGNAADGDDDGDGVADALDAFPLDGAASSDADGDGVGDGSDAFPEDRRESADSDGDGLGDFAESDADADGIPDLATGDAAADMDLLVISAGTDRVLRFDAASGLWAGVEIAEQGFPVALGGPQAAIAWNPYRRELLALAGIAVRRYPRTGPAGQPFLLPPAGGGGDAPLPSSFPAGLAVAEDGTVFVADDGARILSRHDAVSGAPLPGGQFWQQGLFPTPVRDLLLAAGSLWTLERSGRILRLDPVTGVLLADSAASVPEGRGHSALALSPDGSELFIADMGHHRVLRAPLVSPGFTRTAVASGAGGLDQPAGLAFGPDGLLYVSSLGSDQVLRFDPEDGAFAGVFTRAPSGVLSQPRDLLFVPRVRDRFPTDPQRRFRPVAGGWSNPGRSGHGLDVQLVGDTLAVIWYTFEQDGTPVWYLGSGPLSGARWEAALHRFHWDAASRSASSEPAGSASMEFGDERSAVFGWTLASGSGSEAMRPLQVGTSSETQFPTAAWYSPAESGWGLSVTRQGEIAYAIAFVYDASGEPTWLTAAGPAGDASMTLPALRYFAPTRCPGCPGSEGPDATAAGELTFTIVDGSSARVAASFDTGGGTWERTDIPFSRLTESPTLPGGDPLH